MFKRFSEALSRKDRQVEFKPLKDDASLEISNTPYVVVRSQEDGEEDIRTIAEQNMEEGVWLFSAEDGKWFNLRKGYKATTGRHQATIYAPQDYSDFGTDLTHYHTHNVPIYEFEVESRVGRYASELGDLDQVGQKALEKLVRAELAVDTVIPSMGDLVTYNSAVRDMSKGKIEFKIVNPFGTTIVSVQPSEEIVAQYEEVKNALERNAVIDIPKRITTVINEINEKMEGKMKLTLISSDQPNRRD